MSAAFFATMLFAAFSVAAQTNQTLDEKIVQSINQKIPDLTIIKPFALYPPHTTGNPMMESKWITDYKRTVTITISLADSQEYRERSLFHFVFRNISPPNRPIENLGEKAALVSMGDRVEIEFIKANLITTIRMAFPAVQKKNVPFYYMTAPKAEEERALKIAGAIDEAISGKKSFVPCDNDFHRFPIAEENTPEEKLFAAVNQGDTEKVKSIITGNVNLKNADQSGNTVLHSAIRQGCAENIKTLIGAKADVNAKNSKGETPLHIAATLGDAETVKLLLASGADVNAQAEYHAGAAFSAADYALHPLTGSIFRRAAPTEDERIRILRMLKDAGLNFAAKGMHGQTLLKHYFERRGGNVDVVKTLLDFGVEIRDETVGYTTLIKAVNMLSNHTNRNEIVKLLLSRGANVNAKEERGWSALTYARRKTEGHDKNQYDEKERLYDLETIKILIEAGAKE